MAPFDLDQFNTQILKTAGYLLQEPHSDLSTGAVARAVQELAEVTLTRHQVNPELIACHAGCGHCCIVNVAVLSPETDAIIDYLRFSLSQDEQQELARDAETLYQQVRGLDDEERIMLKRSCLFLDETGRCGIYPVRPLLCRALTSTDPQRCRDALAMVALGENVQILSNTLQQDLFTQAFFGLATALEQAGMDSRSRSLVESIRNRLAESD